MRGKKARAIGKHVYSAAFHRSKVRFYTNPDNGGPAQADPLRKEYQARKQHAGHEKRS